MRLWRKDQSKAPVQIIQLATGDVMMITLPAHSTIEDVEHVKTKFQDAFPNHGVLVVSDEIHVAITRRPG